MKHIFISDDKFFLNYKNFGFNVKIVKDPDKVLSIIENENFPLILITEGIFKEIEDSIDLKLRKAIIPIPDRENRGEISKGSIERMLKKMVGGI
jgi:vacuolar-type H+-ATPase subunit F/Vma7